MLLNRGYLLSGNSTSNITRWIGLWLVQGAVGAKVVDVERSKVDLEVMLVGKSVVNFVDGGISVDDCVGHLIHGSLNTFTVIQSKGLKGDFLDLFVDAVKVKAGKLFESIKVLESIVAVDGSGKDTIGDLG